jgi:hypothetical protein
MKQTNSREIEKGEQYQWIQDLILLFLVSHFLYISVLYKCLYSLQHCLAYAKVCAGEKSRDSTEQQSCLQNQNFSFALIMTLQETTIMAPS